MNFSQSWMDNPATQAPASIFEIPRTEGEPDLVEQVRNLLIGSGLVLKVQQHFDNDTDIIQAKGLNPTAQRYLLNRFWNFQFLSRGASTLDSRFYLTDTGDASQWINVFQQFVLPGILENHLPDRLV